MNKARRKRLEEIQRDLDVLFTLHNRLFMPTAAMIMALRNDAQDAQGARKEETPEIVALRQMFNAADDICTQMNRLAVASGRARSAAQFAEERTKKPKK